MTLDDLRAMGVSDADITGLLSFDPSSLTIGGGQDEAARALAAAQATGLSNLGYVPVYGGGDIIPGTTQGILSKLGIENPYTPIFQTVGSENSGTAMDATERTTFAPTPGQTYRLVDNRTGETFGQASDPVGIKALVDQANALSEEQGKKANWDLQQSTLYSADPNQPLKQGWNTIAQDDPNTIPMSIKAMMAAMAVMTGAGVAQGLSTAGTAATGAGAGAGAGAGSGLVPGALSGLSFAPVASVPVAASAVAPIVVTAGAGGLTAAQLAALAGTAAAGTAATTTGGAASGTTTSATTAPAATTTAAATGSELAPITVTAGSSPTNLVPASLLAGGGAAAAAAANAAGSTTSAADLAASRTGMTGAEMAAVNAGAGGTNLLDKIISNMGISDYATLASLAASAVGGGGGGGTGSTTPYVSPFGAGTNFGGLASRTQINPNITDYEKYGFGPEAQFFSGGQGGLAGTGTGTATATKDTPYTGGTLTLPEGTTAGVTPPTTPVTTTTTAPATTYQTNLKDPDIFSYMKTVNDSLGSFYKMGQMTDQQVRDYQQKMYDAINTPGATIDTFRSAVAMPQYTMFNQPTGTPVANVPAPFEYTAPAQPIQNLSAYMNDLNSQIGSRVSQGLLSAADAQKIQGDLTNVYRSGGATTQGLQSAFDAASQKYKPLI